jgi:proteasome assembly chaperone (PAC2) family protein
LDEALAADITGVIVLGAALAEVPHTRPIEVGKTSDNVQVRESVGCERSQYEGHIGITTVVAQFAEQVGIPSVSLWAGVPHYALNSPSPKVTLALLEELNSFAELDIDLTEYRAQSAEWEETVNDIAEGDDDMSDYIQRLEEERDAASAPDASGDAIAAEFEEFLRKSDEGPHTP